MTWLYIYSIVVTILAIYFAVVGALNVHQDLRILNALCEVKVERSA